MDRYILYEKAMGDRALLDEIVSINEQNGKGKNIELVYRNNRQWVIKRELESRET